MSMFTAAWTEFCNVWAGRVICHPEKVGAIGSVTESWEMTSDDYKLLAVAQEAWSLARGFTTSGRPAVEAVRLGTELAEGAK